MTTTTAEVALHAVTKRFGDRAVLDDLDLSIRGGELLAVLGPSGCGKTTALRVIAGFERPDHGRVLIDGTDVTATRASRRGIGIVFQAYSLFPHLTAAENVAYGLRVRGERRADRSTRAAELLDLVGLAGHSAKYPHQLSGGEQQRVALARAFAVSPRVLLLDEPLSALDAKVRVALREEIRRIQFEMGTTTVIVTHDQEEALTMADRVAVMNAGRIDQLGTPDEVYHRPATAFVSSFVGVTNRLPATMAGDGTVEVLGRRVEVSGQPALPGGAVEALVRPEDIDVVADDAGDCMVTAAILRGPVSSLTVTVPGLAQPVRVDLPSYQASAFAAGRRVRLAVRGDTVLVDSPAGPEASAGVAA